MIFLIHRVQARMRGLIARNKVKSSMAAPKGFAGRDNYGKFHYVQHSKIVRIKYIFLTDYINFHFILPFSLMKS